MSASREPQKNIRRSRVLRPRSKLSTFAQRSGSRVHKSFVNRSDIASLYASGAIIDL